MLNFSLSEPDVKILRLALEYYKDTTAKELAKLHNINDPTGNLRLMLKADYERITILLEKVRS